MTQKYTCVSGALQTDSKDSSLDRFVTLRNPEIIAGRMGMRMGRLISGHIL